MRDYYAVLGVEATATAVQIRRAYQRLARLYSPDVNLWERDTRALFDEIAHAYRILSDPTARTLYDRQGGAATGRSGEGAVAGSESGRRGSDVHIPMEISFQQAVSGLEADVRVERLSACDICGATGAAPGATPTMCSHCGGLGTVWSGVAGRGEVCPACDGRAVRVTEPCRACRGRGVRPVRVVVHVTLPPGMDTGGQVRFPGEGHAGPLGGPRGDLIIITRVHEDPVFTRKGDNLYCEVPLTIVEAVLGARIRVRGVGGPVDLIIPPGTQSGQVFRLRGKGVPRLADDGRGDLYVATRVEIPRGLDARTQDLFRELGRLLPGRPELATAGSARE